MFALIDCNNFYTSCERLFRPDLWHKPVVVLSNNDGCVIARSNESKDLGLKMGEPYFKIKDLCKKHGIVVFSSNYTLYGDLSQRVMSTIYAQWPEMEIYSIDEAFLNISSLTEKQQTTFCEGLQQRILQDIGIPTSIGIGKTKTLAKLANYIAKKRLKVPVVNIHTLPNIMNSIEIDEIWGVGRNLSAKLKALGLYSASDLANANPAFIKKRFSVVLQRTLYELNGISCIDLETAKPKQSIVSSRSFNSMQTKLSHLEEALSYHAALAWEKMRQQHLAAQYLSIFILSNPHRKDLSQYSKSIGFKLINPSDDLRHITKCVKLCLKKIYKSGIQYKKAGIMLDGLIPKEQRQMDLFHSISNEHLNHTEQLMTMIEGINQRFGRRTIQLAAEGVTKTWSMRRNLKSPSYTTNWNELPVVNSR